MTITSVACLLEREDELGRLTAAVEGAIASRGCLVLIAGEAGIGKTSLVRALRSQVEQDETFYLLEGEITAWLVEPELAEDRASPPAWVATRGRRCGVGTVVFAPAGTPHTFRVESDTARMLFLFTPAGIDSYVRALAEPAQWPWLQPPPDGPRESAERIAEVERELGIVRHGPAPP